MTLQSQVDAVCRWSPDLSPFHFLLIKEKRHGILAEQKDNMISSQSAVGLDPNYFTNYPDVGQVLDFFVTQHLLVSNLCKAARSIPWNHVHKRPDRA